MRPLIVGTAGHIDHGKTALVISLTGTDPDRLKEEKERGITTDIGFAHTTLPSGRILSFVDVPGHERFVKNMLAGAHGIDAVALVVAADESIKPQTREHLAICGLLGVRRGVVALTKADLVDADTLAVVRAEIEEFTAGSFLAGASIVPVSVRTGQGLDELRRSLDVLAAMPPDRGADGLLRLPVDRVFSVRGFGTVVTGTLLGGTLRVGQAICVLPSARRSRVRGLEVHGVGVEAAVAGNRVAVNLVDLGVDEVARGDVLAAEGTLVATSMFDVELSLLPSARPLKTDSRVRVHVASAERIARVRLLGAAVVEPGAAALAQLRLESPAVATWGDRLILRSYSPAETIAGARVLDPLPPKRKSADAQGVRALADAAREGLGAVVLSLLEGAGARGLAVGEMVARTGVPQPALEELAGSTPSIVDLGGRWIARRVFENLAELARAGVEGFHLEAPLSAGMPRDELRRRSLSDAGPGVFEAVVAHLTKEGAFVAEGDRVRRPQHEVRLSAQEARLRQALEEAAHAAGLQGVGPEQLQDLDPDHTAVHRLSRVLLDSGTLRHVGGKALVHAEHLDTLKAAVRRHVPAGGRLDVAELKNMTGLSRKYVIPLLEFLDKERVTRRVGSERFLLRSTTERS